MARLRYLTAGESHGPALSVIVEGLPAGLPILRNRLAEELERRRQGFGRGARMKLEVDEFEIIGGVRHGFTIGGPVSVIIHNTEWASKWSKDMSPDPVSDPPKPLTRPRPGHADLVGMLKYGFDDARNVLERASARETTARTVAGTFARVLLEQIGVAMVGHTTEIGSVAAPAAVPTPDDYDRIEASEVRCLDPEADAAMVAEIQAAKSDGDTLGGVFEVVVYNLPPGLGSYVHWDRKIDARLAAALISIQAMKGVGFGDGFDLARRRGSAAHDEIFWSEDGGYNRETDRAGGIEGGMTNGSPLRVSVAMKPISTLRKALQTVDTSTKQQSLAIVERSDVCAVPRAVVIGEAIVAFTLADALLEKFGGDNVRELAESHDRYLQALKRA